MCAPQLILTGLSMASQAYAANSTNKQIAKQATVGAENAVQEARFKYGQIEAREYQESVARAQEINARVQAGIRERAQITAELSDQAGEQDSLVRRISIASAIQQAEDIGAVKTEAQFAKEAGMFERTGVDLSTKARLAEAQALKDTMIPPWLTALNMGVSGYQTWKSMAPPRQSGVAKAAQAAQQKKMTTKVSLANMGL